MKAFLATLAFFVALWAILSAIATLYPGPGEADIRGPAKTVTW